MAKFLSVATPRSGTAYTSQAFSNLGLNCGHERYFSLNTRLDEFLANDEVVGECSWLAVPFLSNLPSNVRILHQVRNPLRVIRSLVEIQFLDIDTGGQSRREGLRRLFSEFAIEHCPEVLNVAPELNKSFSPEWISHKQPAESDSLTLSLCNPSTYRAEVARAAWFYYHWNLRIDQCRPEGQVFRYRLEDLDEALLRHLLTFVGIDASVFSDAQLIEHLATIPTDTNAKKNEKVMLVDDITWAALPLPVREMARSYGYTVDDVGDSAKAASRDNSDRAFDLVQQELPEAHEAWRREREQRAKQASELLEEARNYRQQIRELQTLLAGTRYESKRVRQELARVENIRSLMVKIQAELWSRRADNRYHREQIGEAKKTIRQLEESLRTAKAEKMPAVRRIERLRVRVRVLEKELDMHTKEVRYRLGEALVKAAQPSWDTIKLPGRVVKLLLEGIRKRRASRQQAKSLPAASTGAANNTKPTSAAVAPVPTQGGETAPEDGTGAAVSLPSSNEATHEPSYLFFCVNGAGLGHLTRSMAVARRIRRLRPNAPIFFLTSSQALGLISQAGMIGYHIPPFSSYNTELKSAKEWNRLLLAQIRLITDTHKPSVFVYDGVFPYGGLLDAIRTCDFKHAAMILRLRHKHNRLMNISKKLSVFDQLIFPGEIVASCDDADLVPPELADFNCSLVEPIVYLDRDELLPREEARARWGIRPGKKAVYVQLGAGNINDTSSWLDRILDVLAKHDDVEVVLAESPIATKGHATRDGVHILRDYPNSLYYNGFDLAVTAVGYNTFHEQIHFGVPSVLIPNQETKTDDQVLRAMTAHRARAAMTVLSPDDLDEVLGLALGDDVAAAMREKALELVPVNGALTAARILSEAVLSKSSSVVTPEGNIEQFASPAS